MAPPVVENRDLSQKYTVLGLINHFLPNTNVKEILYDIFFEFVDAHLNVIFTSNFK